MHHYGTEKQRAHTTLTLAQKLVTGHPLIVKLYHIWEAGGIQCFALEYIPGGDLFDVLKRERHFSSHRSAKYVLQLGNVCIIGQCASTYMLNTIYSGA